MGVNIASSQSGSNPRLPDVVSESVCKDGAFLVAAADKALKSVLAAEVGKEYNSGTMNENDFKTPPLTPPSNKMKGDSSLDHSGQFTLLLGQLESLIGDVSISQLENRVAIWSTMKESKENAIGQMTKELELAQKEAVQALNKYKTAMENFSLNSSKLSEVAKEDETQKIEALFNVAKEKILNADQMLTQSQALNNSDTDNIQHFQDDNLSNIATFTKLITMFIKIVGKNSEKRIETEFAFFQSLQESRQKEIVNQSAEYEKQIKKAEEINRIIGCVGKVVGALLTVVGVIGAIFTGGAAIALAAIGVALMVADLLCQEFGGFSFMQKALSPLMDGVLKPFMEMVGKLISESLEHFGVDKNTANMVGTILGAVISAIALVCVIVAGVVGGSLVMGKISAVITRLFGETIKKMIPQVLKRVSKTLTETAAKAVAKMGMRSDEFGLKLIANRANTVVAVGTVVNAEIRAAGSITQGVFQQKGYDAMAGFSLASVDIAAISQWLQQSVDSFSDTQLIVQKLVESLSDMLQQNTAASRMVSHQISAS